MSPDYEASDGSLWFIYYEPPPIPIRTLDWQYVADEYDGPGDSRSGAAVSREACIAYIEESIE